MNATIDLFKDQKQGDYTLGQIAEEAEVGTATIVNNFHTKYEVLKAAYDRLLSPVVDTVIGAKKAGVYQPQNGVHELIRYIYGVAKLSHDNRALTVSMIRAYFDIPPEENRALNARHSDDYHPAGHIALGLWPILNVAPLARDPYEILATFGSSWDASTALYHSEALLMGLYRDPSENAPTNVTERVCSELLSSVRELGMSALDVTARIGNAKNAARFDAVFDAFMGRDRDR
ncbi:hypothetical protein ACWDR3_23165 [Streptomyces sp. NPDC001002]